MNDEKIKKLHNLFMKCYNGSSQNDILSLGDIVCAYELDQTTDDMLNLMKLGAKSALQKKPIHRFTPFSRVHYFMLGDLDEIETKLNNYLNLLAFA